MTTPNSKTASPPVPQSAVQALTRAAIFLVATINPGSASRAAVRSFCGDLSALLRAVGFRDIEGNLSCIMGVGFEAWERLFGQPRPAELHPFREIKAIDWMTVEAILKASSRSLTRCRLATQLKSV